MEPRMCEQFKYMVLSCTSCVKCVSLKCTCVSKYGLIRLDQPRSRMFDLQPFSSGVEKEKLRITAQQLPSLNSIGSDKTQHDDVQLILRTRFDFIYWGCNPAD